MNNVTFEIIFTLTVILLFHNCHGLSTIFQFEYMLESVLLARDRWLKEGGMMWPSSACLTVVPCQAFSDYMEKMEFWEKPYGLDFSYLQWGLSYWYTALSDICVVGIWATCHCIRWQNIKLSGFKMIMLFRMKANIIVALSSCQMLVKHALIFNVMNYSCGCSDRTPVNLNFIHLLKMTLRSFGP